MSSTPPDYAALFRAVISEWGRMTSPGGQPPGAEEFARAIGGGTGQGSEAFRGVMERALAAANMPSRAEIEDISARLARIEGALFRMEARLNELAARDGSPGGQEPPA